MVSAILKYTFLQNALFAALLSAILCGLIGVILSEKKMLMMSGGIAHTAYGGVGLGYLIGFEPIIGAGIFASLSAIVIGTVRKKGGVHTDIIISLLWSLGMASGVLFTTLMPSFPPDMNSYLFGNILTVTKSDLYIMAGVTAVVIITVAILFNDWKAFLFDEQFCTVSGIKTNFLEYLLLILTSLSIVVLIRVVGIILVIALLSAPSACAALISKKLSGRMIIAGVLSFIFCFAGICFSYYLEIASGAAIVFISVLTYFALLLFKKR